MLRQAAARPSPTTARVSDYCSSSPGSLVAFPCNKFVFASLEANNIGSNFVSSMRRELPACVSRIDSMAVGISSNGAFYAATAASSAPVADTTRRQATSVAVAVCRSSSFWSKGPSPVVRGVYLRRSGGLPEGRQTSQSRRCSFDF